MLLKSDDARGASKPEQKSVGRLWRTLILSRLILIAVGAIFAGGILFQRAGLPAHALNNILTNAQLPLRYAQGIMASPERVAIDISFKNFQRLSYQREAALAVGTLLTDSTSFVPAQVQVGDSMYNVAIRLKGDLPDHFSGDKWSLRVRVKGDHTIFGMKQFSLQTPETRNFIFEWIFHETMRREGLIALRYGFVDVTINGKDMGLYAIEESFEKRLVEHNQRREGPIIKFDETNLWKESIPFDTSHGRPGAGHYFAMPIDAFQSGGILGDSALFAQYQVGLNLLEGFREGTLRASEVFEIDRFAKYVALCDLLGAFHALNVIQFRFYYDPVAGRLEPIAFDANAGRKINELACAYSPVEEVPWRGGVRAYFIARLFEDGDFYARYAQELSRISARQYLDSLLSDLEPGLDTNLRLIYSEYPAYRFSTDQLYQNQEFVRASLHPVKLVQPHFVDYRGGIVTLEVANVQQLPVSIGDLHSDGSALFIASDSLNLPARRVGELLSFARVKFTAPASFLWSDSVAREMRLTCAIIGTNEVREEAVVAWPHFDSLIIQDHFMRFAPNARSFHFLVFDESTRTITIAPGVWTIDRDIIIPPGYVVTATDDIVMDLRQGAKILSYSPFHFRGDGETSILVRSSDSLGQGLLIMADGRPSLLEGVTFVNLSNPVHGAWALTGAVNLYESPVELRRCTFVGNRCEDALNTIRGEFVIDSCVFSQTMADAFDADFCQGIVSNAQFINCGNDAIDASGSDLQIHNVSVDGAGDKGISIGESSRATIRDVKVSGAEIAFASKDLSHISMRNVNIHNSRVGFAVYQKKPEYGPGSVVATMLEMQKVATPFLIESHSRVSINGVDIESNEEKVKSQLYGVKYGKSSQ